MSENSKLVSYDLLKEGQNYNDLYDLLKSFSVHRQINESFWMINTSLTCKELRDKLESVLDSNDRVFVTDYGETSAWTTSIDQFKSDIIHKSSDDE